jgi:hypothetical protein
MAEEKTRVPFTLFPLPSTAILTKGIDRQKS